MDTRPEAAERLKQARLARGLTLADVAARTCIDVRMLSSIEQGQFDRLPAGIYARAWVKSFAASVGVSPAEVIALVEAELPRVDDNLPRIVETLERNARRGPTEGSRRVAAAMCDALVLTSVDAVYVALGTVSCGVTPAQFVDAAPLPLLLLFLIVGLAYFGILGGLGGRTLGGMICDVPGEELPGPCDLLAAGRRGVRCFLAEASLLVPWMRGGLASENR
jgi:transcriptional regulator with XRE-family HTH domain